MYLCYKSVKDGTWVEYDHLCQSLEGGDDFHVLVDIEFTIRFILDRHTGYVWIDNGDSKFLVGEHYAIGFGRYRIFESFETNDNKEEYKNV